MSPKPIVVALLAVASTFVPSGAFAQADAQCSAKITQLESNTRTFASEAQKQNLDFLQADMQSTSLKGVQPLMNASPTADVLSDLKEKKEQFDEWADSLRKVSASVQELLSCMNTPGCKALDIVKRQNREIKAEMQEMFKRWAESLGDEGMNGAIERVRKANSLLQGYVKSIEPSNSGAGDAIDECSRVMEQRVRATDPTKGSSTPATPVSTPSNGSGDQPGFTPATPPNETAEPGTPVGKYITLGAVTAGGLAGLKYWQDQQAASGANCPTPTLPVSACFDPKQGGSSPACRAALTEVDAYCACKGMKRGSGTEGFNQCVPK
jgi:uncharacterized protein YoxC